MTEPTSSTQEPVGYAFGDGGWREFLHTLPRPVLAVGKSDLYCVMLHATGFTLDVGTEAPGIGCFTTRFVAGHSVREAEARAISAAQQDWHRRGLYKACGGVLPQFTVEELTVLPTRFRFRSGGGFGFYTKPSA